MAKIRVTREFKWARDGVHVETYAPGEHDVPERCAEVALEEGWAKPVAPAKRKRKPAAPAKTPAGNKTPPDES